MINIFDSSRGHFLNHIIIKGLLPLLRVKISSQCICGQVFDRILTEHIKSTFLKSEEILLCQNHIPLSSYSATTRPYNIKFA